MNEDCVLDEEGFNSTKQIYRIIADAPDTNESIVGWIDWDKREVICAVKRGVIVECTDNAYYGCFEGNLHWFDSCGNPKQVKQSCFGSCHNRTCRPVCIGENGVFNTSENITCCENLDLLPVYNIGAGGMCLEEFNETGACTRCGDGLCIEPEDQCNCPEDCNVTCTDSDGGRAYNITGTTRREGETFRDECTGIRTVKEYYCQYRSVKSESYDCGLGSECYYGRCINSSRPCIREGDTALNEPGYECCPGLVEGNTTRPENNCTEIIGVFICISCPDGTCGPGENTCNCPQDCVA
jgi:hypothetical protein